MVLFLHRVAHEGLPSHPAWAVKVLRRMIGAGHYDFEYTDVYARDANVQCGTSARRLGLPLDEHPRSIALVEILFDMSSALWQAGSS